MDLLALLAATGTGSTDPLDFLRSVGALGTPALLAGGMFAYAKQIVVPGSLYRQVKKERDDLQQAVIDKVIPAVTEANLMGQQFNKLILTTVSLNEPRQQ